MLDLNALLKKQKEGDRLVASLTPDESIILQNYCLLSAQGLIQAGLKRQESTNNIIINAFRNGICLGLGLEVRQGQVLERSKS
jgi:hypothetical protein